MTASNLRQKYLNLIARLYDIASEFTDEELRAIRETLADSGHLKVGAAVDLLLEMHGESFSVGKVGQVQLKQGLEPTLTSQVHDRAKSFSGASFQDIKRAVTGDIKARSSILSLFSDKELFPTVSDISKLLPGDLAPLPKEGRDRYVRRVTNGIQKFNNQETDIFRGRLRKYLDRRQSGFVSNWKSAIRDL